MARQQTGGRTKAVFFLVASLAVAAITAFIVVQVLRRSIRQMEEAKKPPETVDVVVATRDLYMGMPITQEDIAVRSVLPEMVPGDLVFASLDEVVHRTPRERILANEVIRYERLARRDAGVGLNAIITAGKRAMSVSVDTESGVAGFLQPGNFVDVIVTIKPDDKDIEAKWVTETILQGIKVLAVDSSMGNNKEEKDKKQQNRRTRPSVTIELSLEEAEKMALASSKGDIHLVLRSDVDITIMEQGEWLTTDALIGFKPEEKPQPVRRGGTKKAEPKLESAQIIQGEDVQTTKFNEQGEQVEEKTRGRR